MMVGFDSGITSLLKYRLVKCGGCEDGREGGRM